jgi:signal transduction histidine kinase
MIFQTKSRAIELLGRNSIRDGTTALAELLKNSYDADAPWARAMFTTNCSSPYLMLCDSGCGMSEKDLKEKWLVIGTNSKKRDSNDPRLTPKGRRLMGEKGIGRLASACLGDQVLLISKSEKTGRWSMLFINWIVFENFYSFIGEVDIGSSFNMDFSFTENIEQLISYMVQKVYFNLFKDSWFQEVNTNENDDAEDDEKFHNIVYDPIQVGLIIKDLEDLKIKTTNLNESINPTYVKIKKDLEEMDTKINIQLRKLNDKIFMPRNDLNDLRDTIEIQLLNIHIPFQALKSQLSLIEQTGRGTLMCIINLREDWKRILEYHKSSKDKITDIFADKSYTRLQTFLFPFINTKDKFNVELYNNTEKLSIYYGFTEKDYECYDIKIEGRVEDGRFYGEINAVNAPIDILNNCNAELRQGIDVSGNIDWDIKVKDNCGSYSLKLCHIEGSEKNTGLDKQVWNDQKEKLDKFGGVMIFRDGVRILPYGEPENDFLELEKRRLLRVGDYPFAHKRLFGRIDIARNDNPSLIDKASREGFVENESFYYFVSTLKTLLQIIAQRYLNEIGIRKSMLDYNNEEHERKQQELRIINEQKRLLKAEISRIKSVIKENEKSLAKLSDYISRSFTNLENLFVKLEKSSEYDEISEYYNKLSHEMFNLLQAISDNQINLKVIIAEQFKSSVPDELTEDVVRFNKNLSMALAKHSGTIEYLEFRARESYTDKMRNWKISAEDFDADDISYYKDVIHQSFKNNILHLLYSIGKSLNEDIDDRMGSFDDIIKSLNNEISSLATLKIDLNTKVKELKRKYAPELNKLCKRINNIETLSNENIKGEIDSIDKEIQHYIKTLHKAESELKKEIFESYENAAPKIKEIMNFTEHEYSTQELIDALTKKNADLEHENDIMTDLANTGLAAEIVDHEFNQYFTNVMNAIRDLKRTSLTVHGKHYMNQIETGFRAISNRHSQLSKTYRSYNLKRTAIKVIDLVTNSVDFFGIRLNNSSIKVEYDISNDAIIKISASKIYPVLSNLLDNAIYWASTKGERKILWRYESEENSLYIEDSGPGISPRVRDKIFNKFYTEKPYGLGRGLGLTISKKVLEMEGYSIEVILDEKIKTLPGACFKIKFAKESQNI